MSVTDVPVERIKPHSTEPYQDPAAKVPFDWADVPLAIVDQNYV